MPALAVADALRADGAEVEFVGAGRAEAQLVPAGERTRERADDRAEALRGAGAPNLSGKVVIDAFRLINPQTVGLLSKVLCVLCLLLR